MSDDAVLWMDRWQLECCGTPFAVGDAVTWTVRTDVDRDFLSRAASPELAASIDLREEHHDDGDDQGVGPTRRATGVVAGIRALTCRYAMDAVEGAALPVAGSGLLQPVTDSGEAVRPGDERYHLGWVVELRSLHFVGG
jgi:hypothetical protein